MRQPITYLLAAFLCLLLVHTASAQNPREERLAFGLQLKPIVPSELFRTGPDAFSQNNIDYVNRQRPGYGLGMFIRKSFTKRLAIETGINYVVRNFRTSINVQDEAYVDSLNFRIVGYEIPLQGLVYVRLGKRFYMNNAFGFSFNMFPSNVASGNQVYQQTGLRRGWLQLGLLANHGYEYRSEKSGTFYLGATLHRPFGDMYRMRIRYTSDNIFEEAIRNLNGQYFTIDFRYAFHEEGERKGVVKRKKEKQSLRDYLPW